MLLREKAAGPATHILAYGGSRSGKTFGFCYCVAMRALAAPESRHLVARLHNVDVRQAVLMDTFPTMMRKALPGVPYTINKADQYVVMPDNSEIWFSGLDDKERVEKILGKEFSTIYPNECSQLAYDTILILRTRLAQNVRKRNGDRLRLKAYYDLNPVGRSHWTYREFVEGVRPENGLPLPPGSRDYVILNPDENPYLPPEYISQLDELPELQRQRFRDGRYLSEVPNTLWPLERIDQGRRDTHPPLTRIVVAVDPSGSDGVGGDSQGIVVVGRGEDGHGYVLEDATGRHSPARWGEKVASTYRKWDADLIVAESNFGGAMVEETIKKTDANLPVKLVRASRGKHIRAEPVAALYEAQRDRPAIIHHVGRYVELEDQMAMMTTEGYQGSGSPDRLDALVWAVHELMLAEIRPFTWYVGS